MIRAQFLTMVVPISAKAVPRNLQQSLRIIAKGCLVRGLAEKGIWWVKQWRLRRHQMSLRFGSRWTPIDFNCITGITISVARRRPVAGITDMSLPEDRAESQRQV